MERLRQTEGKIPYDEARDLLHGVLQGLNDAHTAGVIHGDIKPANVRFGVGATDEDLGFPKLSDFGAARRVREDVPGIRGSTNWMAPEVIEGERSTEASDYFSFGVLAYLLLTGQHPYFANDPSCLTNEEDNIVSATFKPQPLDSHRSDIPQTVCALVMDLLSRDRDTRLRAGKELKAALSGPIEPAPHTPSYAPEPPSPLSKEQLDRLNQAYKDAKDWFFGNFRPVDALSTIDIVVSEIELDDVRGTKIPVLADLCSLRGYISNSGGQYGEAIQAATRGLEIDPTHVNSLHIRAYANVQLGKYERAKEDLDRALEFPTTSLKRNQLRQLLDTVRDRLEIIPNAPVNTHDTCAEHGDAPLPPAPAPTSWARFLKRVFNIDISGRAGQRQ